MKKTLRKVSTQLYHNKLEKGKKGHAIRASDNDTNLALSRENAVIAGVATT